MNSRDRVLRTLGRKKGEPDRVPLEFDLCKELLEHFSKKMMTELNYTHNLWEDVTYRISGNEIRTAMGSDFVVTGAGQGLNPEVTPEKGSTWVDEYGITLRQGPIYVEPIDYPLANAQKRKDISDYQFPDLDQENRFKDCEKKVSKFKDDYFLIGDMELTIFGLARQLIGMEKLLKDLLRKKDYTSYLFDRCKNFQIDHGLRLVKHGVDAIWMGDDFGSQTGMMISPELFRQVFKPKYEEMIKRFREENPNITIIFHSDGAIKPIIPDLIGIGVDVLNPIQPGVPGHSPRELVESFGEDICFFGGIDQQYLLPKGTDEELKNTIKERIQILNQHKSYIIAPAHIIQSDTSPSRVKKFIEYSMKYGGTK